jgi:hypothetical protein
MMCCDRLRPTAQARELPLAREKDSLDQQPGFLDATLPLDCAERDARIGVRMPEVAAIL